MKSKEKSNLIIIGILFVLLPIITTSLSYITDNNNKSLDYSDDFTLDRGNLKISEVSGKIHIDGNSSWAAFKAAGNCTGDGTYSEPYVIQDLVIDGEGLGSCILIENSNVFFKIENCTVFNVGETGIELFNVANSQLIDNNCSYSYTGIRLEDSFNNTISGNTAKNNIGSGMYLERGAYNTISGNTANNNGWGVYIENGDYNTISGNTANNNDYAGITISDDYNTISGNTANNNEWGVKIIGDYNTISGNTANNNNQIGIELASYSSHNTISGNTANNNNFDGIHLRFINSHNTISGNTAINNTRGVFLWEGEYDTISGNTAINNTYGIYLDFSPQNTISGNTAINNSVGIYLTSSDVNTVSGNTFIGNNECIVEDNCLGNKFSDNGDCTYGQVNGGIPIELIVGISVISGGAVIGVAALLLIIRKRKRME